MRVMVIVKASKESEAGVLPSEKELSEMSDFNDELLKAGVMLAGEGLRASSKGARVRFDKSGKGQTVSASRCVSRYKMRPYSAMSRLLTALKSIMVGT